MAGLTGKIRYRTNWRRKLILQVQFAYRRWNSYGRFIEGEDAVEWRDALTEDLLAISEFGRKVIEAAAPADVGSAYPNSERTK